MADSFLRTLVRNLTGGTPVAQTPWGFQTTSPSAGLGYGAGAGGQVTQLTSKATAFTLNAMTGRIIFNNSALPGFATSSSALWTNAGIGPNDVIVFMQDSGSQGAYEITAICSSGGGAATIFITNQSSSSLSEAVAVRFTVLKGSVT